MLALASLWCIGLVLINPAGDFPLNDDWSYGRVVKGLIESGDFTPTGWTSMPLLTDALWGALFCLPAGFSFTALRLSTLALSLLGMLAFYLVMRELRAPRWLAMIASLTLGFNPIYCALSNTFMTDVHFVAIMIVASYFFARCLRTGSTAHALAGTALSIAGVLSRQLAIAVPLAFAVASLLRRGARRGDAYRAVAPPVLCIGALLAYQGWLAGTGRVPAAHAVQTDNLLRTLADFRMLVPLVASRMYISVMYVGWFLLPLLPFAVRPLRRAGGARAIALLALSGAALAAVGIARAAVGKRLLMPLSSNVIVSSGIGPLTLRDAYFLNLDHVPPLPDAVWVAVTVGAAIGAVLLVTIVAMMALGALRALRAGGLNEDESISAFFLLSAALYMPAPLVAGFFDRYLIFVVPFLAAAIAGASGGIPSGGWRAERLASAVLLASLACYGVCGTRDYLAWNRARWQALNDVMKDRRAEPGDIDGGFEFNGWHLYDPAYRNSGDRSWWWVRNDRYRIGFGPMPGYAGIGEYGCSRWLPPGRIRIVAMERVP